MHSSGNTFANAVVGAVVALVLVVLPFSPAVGGGAAGYLQRGRLRDGATAGTVTGLLVAFPLFVGVVLLAPLFVFAPAGVPSIPTNPVVFVVLALLATVTYAVGSAAVGGAVGAYLAAVRHHDADASTTDGLDARPGTESGRDPAPTED
ncbi:DUF5518 domain-containing protein [Halorubellus salinus]|uniref:DUF5518 domain-containing protein n=1 Tax=Halorubellus salinus TaxID=755309 RepID=UPI001D08DF22|nr:DUF5518 domain-containing protein [Halorubellus salinus]